MIVYRTDHSAIDLPQLATLFRTAGWAWRAEDPVKLAALLEGSRFVSSAHDDGASAPGAARSTPEGVLVGFCRAISDGVTNAYVSTVAVLPEYRGKGIGAELVKRLLEGRDTIRFVLHAAPGVQGFYRKLGFEDASDMLRRDRRA
jgi:ribosomal protein S18 acetylase RimI-like enzyme